MNANKLQELKNALLKLIPNGCVLDLSGKYNAENRRLIMQAILERKCTLAECGVTALEKALYTLAGIESNTGRQMERDFKAWLLHKLGEKMDFNTFWDWLQFKSPQAKIHFKMINEVLRYTTPGAPEAYVRKYYTEYLAE